MSENKKLNEKELDKASGGIFVVQVDDDNKDIKNQNMNLYDDPSPMGLNKLDPTKPLDDEKGKN